jgi:rhamnopyranosyl-N-acetylglucosaminyl-diphospho-decaprenol beta-1,3/1,4-galactofuranosyltransferase
MNTIVCTIIVAYRRKSEFVNCLDYILEQVISVSNILIVDNSELNIFSNCIKKPYLTDKIIYIPTSVNLGSAGGFFLGMQKAFEEGAEWIWLHDEDDYPERDCLQKLLSSGRGSIRAPVIKDPDTGNVLNYFKRKKGWLGYLYPAPEKSNIVDAAGTAGLLIHRKVIEAAGIYDQEFFVGFEDWDYCLRAAKKGFSVHVVHDAVVYHPDHQSLRNVFIKEKILKYLPPLFGFIRKGNIRDEYAVRNIIILTKRHMPIYVLPLSLILSIFSLPVFKIINHEMNISLTLKTYLKSLCVE